MAIKIATVLVNTIGFSLRTITKIAFFRTQLITSLALWAFILYML